MVDVVHDGVDPVVILGWVGRVVGVDVVLDGVDHVVDVVHDGVDQVVVLGWVDQVVVVSLDGIDHVVGVARGCVGLEGEGGSACTAVSVRFSTRGSG